jgi:hypothetical protein
MVEVSSGTIVSIPIKTQEKGAFPNESYIYTEADGMEISGFIDNDFVEDNGNAIVGVVVNTEDDKIIIRFNGDLNKSTTVVSRTWFSKNAKKLELR